MSKFSCLCQHCGNDFICTRGTHSNPQKYCSQSCWRASTTGTAKIARRFWSKVTKTEGCWLWNGSLTPSGYGQFSYKGRPIHASRAAFQIVHGVSLGPKDFVCHKCDNPRCVRPDHLFLGSPKDNVKDMVAKKRNRCTPKYGENHHQAKLSLVQVTEIRDLYATGGVTQRQLAKKFGVTQGIVGRIIRHENWNAEAALLAGDGEAAEQARRAGIELINAYHGI